MKPSHKVLISAPYLLNDFRLFERELKEKGIDFDVYPVEERLEEADLLEIIDQYHGVICGDDRFTPKVFDQAKELKTVVKWGTGIDSIDKAYAATKGISVRNTLNAFTEPVSDSILAIILAFTRKLIASDRIMKAGLWEKAFGISMSEVRVGIIGYGNIGRATSRKLQAFNTQILASDIQDIPDEEYQKYGVEKCGLDDLLKSSDFVVIACDLNSKSRHLLHREKFQLMKAGAVVINTARGPIIKEEDLVWALQNQVIAGAGLDVFEEEPLPKSSPLRQMNNVFLSSHNVNASPKYWSFIHRNSLNMLYEELGI